MPAAIGQVVFISGKVLAIDISGQQRELSSGARVYPGETVITEGNDSRLVLEMHNGQLITLGRNDQLALDSDVYDPEQMPFEEGMMSVENIQDALQNDPNFDPSHLEAAASGGAMLSDSSALPNLITHDMGDVGFGFLDTTGISDQFLFDNVYIADEHHDPNLNFPTLTLSGLDMVIEGNQAIYSLSLNTSAVTDLIIEITISHIDTSNGDITPEVRSLTIAAGSSRVDFTVATLDDYISDSGERFNVAITGTTGGGFSRLEIANDQVVTTIIDDSGTPNTPNDGPESDHEAVIIKLVAADAAGNPVIAGGQYVLVEDVNEGDSGFYIALAFEPGSVPSPATQIASSGSIDVMFSDNTASGSNLPQSRFDGSEDYNSSTQTVTIGTAFSTATFDDYLSDNNENFNVSLVDKTYTAPTTNSGYENVIVDTTAVVTTIKDDTGTPHTPNDGPETDHEAVILKLVAADASGNPLIVGGQYVLAEDVNEGDNGYYIALAFAPGSVPSPATQIASNGTIDVAFSDNSATGSLLAQSRFDGTEDYTMTPQTVAIGTAFSTSTFDDYLADSGESFNVRLVDLTYTPPTPTTGYENVTVDTTAVVTTIVDDTGTPNIPNDGPEADHEAVIIKLVAADAVGNPVLLGGQYVLASSWLAL